MLVSILPGYKSDQGLCARPMRGDVSQVTIPGAQMFALSVRSSVALLLGVTAAPLLSQTIVSGVVRADRGKPIAGAVVQIKSTHGGVTTDTSGLYRLVIPNDGFATVDSLTVTARAVGFQPRSRRIPARPGSVTLDFALEASPVKLESVVVTRTGTSTDAVSSRGGKDSTAPTVAGLEASVADSREARPAMKAPALAKARADGSRVAGRASAAIREPQDQSPGILTAAVWNDAEHWQ